MQKPQRRWRSTIAAGLAIALGAFLVMRAAPATRTVSAQEPSVIVGMQSLPATISATVTPSVDTVQTSDTPFILSQAQRDAAEAHMEKVEEWMAARAVPRSAASNVVVPMAPETATSAPSDSAPTPDAPNTLQIHHNSVLTGAPGAPPGFGVASVAEPSIAYNGKNVWMTWNWGAAKSTTSGYPTPTSTGWTYVNPTVSPTFPDFCCDQDAIYDKGRDILIWERMGINPAPGHTTNENRVMFSVSKNFSTFCTYQIFASQFGRSNELLDYPRMALSTDYLYVSFNGFSTTSGGFIEHVILKLPLDTMRACASLSYSGWAFAQGWSPAAIENATDTMYFGDQLAASPTTNQFVIYWNPQGTSTLNSVVRTITGFTFTNRGSANCPVAGGANPCARFDQRVLGGVISNNGPAGPNSGQLDFFWNVAQGGSFPLPYSESAGFDLPTLTYNARKLVWNPSWALVYTNVAANDRGDTGLSVQAYNSSTNPMQWLGVDDNYNGTPPGWEVIGGVQSTGTWTQNNSGDFFRVRSYAPAGVGWVTTGVYRDASLGSYVPFFTAFNRGRDEPGMVRFDKK